MAFKEGSDARIRYGRVLGLLFIVAGFVVIGLAWNGAAGKACVDCQFPYLLSGGFGGLGLVVTGAALLVVSGLRAERRHLQDALEGTGSGPRAPGATGDVVMPGAGADGGAAAAQPAATGAVASGATASPADGMVVAGRTTYHRPECRLVKGKSLAVVSVAQAVASGLTPCRICQPTVAGAEAATVSRST